MRVESYNNNRYLHITKKSSGVDYWWDTALSRIVPKATIQNLVLIKNEIILGCGTLCEGPTINCCDDSLLANNLDCLFSNDSSCLLANP
jgi:hypothetical protein